MSEAGLHTFTFNDEGDPIKTSFRSYERKDMTDKQGYLKGFPKPTMIAETVAGVSIGKITIDPGKDDFLQTKIAFKLNIDGKETDGKVDYSVSKDIVDRICEDAKAQIEAMYGITKTDETENN